MITIEDLKDNIQFAIMPETVRSYINVNAVSLTLYVSHLCFMDGEPVIRTWAFKRKNKKTLECTEVERKALHLELSVTQNIYYTSIGGYHPVYKLSDCPNDSWYSYRHFDASDFNKWYSQKPIGVFTHLINALDITGRDEYRYCGYQDTCGDLFEYLRLYEKNPKVEFFGKLGIRPRATLISKASKNPQFARYIRDNAKMIDVFGPQCAIYAFDHSVSFPEADKALTFKRNAMDFTKNLTDIRTSGIDRVKLYKWMADHHIAPYLYRDYFNAAVALGLDMHDTKNLYPHDFMRMHDLRINEYDAMKEREDRIKKRKFYKSFARVAANLKKYELPGDKYSIIIPRSVTDIQKEGTALHHCVYKMGYDKKMERGDCIIAFIRKTDDISTPYVTVEFLIKEHKVSQVYADHDSRPPEEVCDLAKRWGEIVTKMMKAS